MKSLRLKKINIEVLLKLIILLGFAFFFYHIIRTGKVLLYVNPRIIPYIKFGIIAMILLSTFIVRDLFKSKRKVYLRPYLLFIIPLIMAFMLPAKSAASTSMSLETVKKTTDTTQIGIKDNIIPNETNSNNTVSSNTNTINQNKELKMLDGIILVNDNNFMGSTQEISYNMVKYEGKKITLTGFVFKTDEFKENEFVAARLMMSCCAADLQPVGLLCNYNKANQLKQDTWIIVKGEIKITDYNGEKTPVIIVESIESTNKPTNEYVYPY